MRHSSSQPLSLPENALERTPPQRANAALLDRFKELIAAGVLRPGSRLPAERDLARQFGVNRTTLRHTLKLLDTLGVVSQRVGDGTYVSEQATAVLDQPIELMILLGDISIEERYQARQVVEPQLAAQAAERAGSRDLALMRGALAALATSTTPEGRRGGPGLPRGGAGGVGNRVCPDLPRAASFGGCGAHGPAGGAGRRRAAPWRSTRRSSRDPQGARGDGAPPDCCAEAARKSAAAGGAIGGSGRADRNRARG